MNDDEDEDIKGLLKQLGKVKSNYPDELYDKRREKFVNKANRITILWHYGFYIGVILLSLIGILYLIINR